MNNKRVKKVRKILLKNYNDLLFQAQQGGFIDRIKISFIIIFRINFKNKFNVINKS